MMTLLVGATVIFLPLTLPLLLPGAQVNAAAIALHLILEMLVPLAIGLFVKARYDEMAATLQPHIVDIALFQTILLFSFPNMSDDSALAIFPDGCRFRLREDTVQFIARRN